MIFDFSNISSKPDGMGIYTWCMFREFQKQHVFKAGDTLILRPDITAPLIKDLKIKRINDVHNHRLMLFFYKASDLYYSPTHHGPVFDRNKILTIHDLIPLEIPRKNCLQFFYQAFFLRLGARRTKTIITVSKFSRDKIIKLFNVNKHSISVIYNGTDIEAVLPERVDDIPNKFFLMIGVNSQYKNFDRVAQAFQQLNDPEMRLIITSQNPSIVYKARKQTNIMAFDYLTRGQVRYLLERATALIFPSIIEGFGLPVLEAARLKIPVITSRASPMEEFLGSHGAFYVNPYSPKEIAAAMSALTKSATQKCTEHAYNATKDFTWENHSKQVISLLDKYRN